MTRASHTAAIAARDEILALLNVPDAALDWRPAEDEWSARQILEHIGTTGPFFAYIIDSARASGFGDVTLDRDELGRRLAESRQEFAPCVSAAAVREFFARSFEDGAQVAASVREDELDRPFRLRSLRPGGELEATTLRHRVVERFGQHLREHEAQLRAMLGAWGQTQGESHRDVEAK